MKLCFEAEVHCIDIMTKCKKAYLELIRLDEGFDGADARASGKKKADGPLCCWGPFHPEALPHHRGYTHFTACHSSQPAQFAELLTCLTGLLNCDLCDNPK